MSLTGADWTQTASTAFAALAALAAWATVVRSERDRKDRRLPDLHVDLIYDMPNQEVRATVVNYGGPACDVRIGGVEGTFGYYGLIGPTSYWRSGEMRTILIAVPPGVNDVNHTYVEGRDVKLRYLFAATTGGIQRRWPLRKAKELSPADLFSEFFPGVTHPIDALHSPILMTTVDRAW